MNAATPLERTSQLPAAHEASPAPAATPREFGVLVVEDSVIVSQRLIALIDRLRLPIQVTAVTDGLHAAACFESQHPDAVVLDIELPGLNGFDLLALIKLRRPDCVVIILTTYAYPEFRDNALRLGADYFFDKAMEFERVPGVLSALVATHLAPS